MLPPPRSVLFLPATNVRAVAKARASDADAVVLDLEDAVAPDAKVEARAAARNALSEGGWGDRPTVVRVNGLDTAWGADDVAALADAGAHALLLPKVGDPSTLAEHEGLLGKAPAALKLWSMVESASGVLALPAIAASGGRLRALVLGFNDLALDLQVDNPPVDRAPFRPVMSAAVLAARANGLLAFDAPCNVFRTPDRVSHEARQAMQHGFDGKALIHPDQIGPCHAAFAPSADRVRWAQAVCHAFADPGQGAVAVDGRMVERLHLEQARRILAKANR